VNLPPKGITYIYSMSAFSIFVGIWTLLAIVLFPVLMKITAPYGRHLREGWGTMINNTLGWIVMELPSPVCFTVAFLSGGASKSWYNYFFMLLWLLHYINRSLIFPLRYPDKHKKMPVSIVLQAVLFNVVNGSINGYYLGSIKPYYAADYWLEWNFILGIALFALGVYINIQSDNILLNLRKPGESGYKIPYGGMFRYVSSPNYLGEIIEWTGYALACWSLPALSFAVWTIANLVPRAIAHHRWYQRQFSDYPAERKALIPFVI
jgi:3-oxo-5-alpha-steroid 4-dehydrogenase 1